LVALGKFQPLPISILNVASHCQFMLHLLFYNMEDFFLFAPNQGAAQVAANRWELQGGG
jgi:hypothetical protein